ncbi:MAG: alpha/beta hydrolase family protein [Nevskiales bacterium]
MSTRQVEIPCADGRMLPATVHGAVPPWAVVVIAAGLGIPRRFYDKFAAYLSQRGITALTFDYRGVGEGQGSTAEDAAVDMEQWGRLDIDAVLDWSLRSFPGVPLFHAGHSAGGQLVGLAAAAEKLTGLVLVAANAPHASQWRGKARLRILVLWYLLAPLLAAGRARFPMRRLGLSSVDVPAGVIRQWARWGRSQGYLFNSAHGHDTARYRQLRSPALVLEFTDDADFAPPAAVDALLAQMPNLQLTRRRIAPQEASVKSIGHLGFFRDALRDTLWRDAADWILATANAAKETLTNVSSRGTR